MLGYNYWCSAWLLSLTNRSIFGGELCVVVGRVLALNDWFVRYMDVEPYEVSPLFDFVRLRIHKHNIILTDNNYMEGRDTLMDAYDSYFRKPPLP